jgi:hypothetical protein
VSGVSELAVAHERGVHTMRSESGGTRERLHDVSTQYAAGPQQLLQHDHPLAKPRVAGVLAGVGASGLCYISREMNGARVRLSDGFRLLRRTCERAPGVLGLLVLCVSTTTGCGSSCDGIRHVPAGTWFRVSVLGENPNSTGCHWYRVSPGDDFELVAGAKTSSGVGGEVCEVTGPDGAPIGPEADFVYENCTPHGQMSSECQAAYAMCPGHFGYVGFSLNADLPDQSPTVGRFSIHHRAPITCRDFKSCVDTYDVRVERLP